MEFVFKPFFTIEPLSQREFRDQKVDILDHTAIVFTSRMMMRHFFNLLKELRITPPDDLKYFCSNEMLSNNLQKFITVRKRKVYYPEKTVNGGSDLSELLLKHSKEVFFIPTIEGSHHEAVLNDLDEAKIAYSKADLSRVVYTSFTAEELGAFDLILFFSPNGVESLFHSFPKYKQGHQLLGCLGEKTKEEMERRGLKVGVMAPTKDFPSITAALEYRLQNQ